MSKVTVSEFIIKMEVGKSVRSELYWPDKQTGELKLTSAHSQREILSKNTVGFTLKTWYDREQKFVPGHCNWPKRNELDKINDTTYSITTYVNGKPDSKLIYEIL